MITNYKIFEETQIQKFEIPKQIKKFYIIEGDMSNAKNWKSTKYFNPFNLDEKYRKSALGIRYVLISTDTNHIIPINMNDEHHRGLDVLYDVFYDEYKVPQENYLPVDSWGTSYIYNIDNEKERNDNLIVFQKFLNYGGNPNAKIHFEATVESDYKPYEMTIEQFLITDGLYKNYMKKLVGGENISSVGKELIQIIEDFTNLWLKYTEISDRMGITKGIEKRIFELIETLQTFLFCNEHTYKFIEDISNQFYNNLSKKDIEEIGKTMLSHDGLKNKIHIKLKNPDKNVKTFFWNTEKAKEEFNRLSNL
jgi:hypothetical protein